MSVRLRNGIYVVLLFLSGSVVGAFSHRLYTLNTVTASTRPSPEDFRKRYVGEMRTRLNLTPDQLSKLENILDSTRTRYRSIHERIRPDLKATQEDQVSQIRAILNESQRAEYEKLRKERDERRKPMRPEC